MASIDSQIDKPQHGHPKRAELWDVNINTGVQSINTERASVLFLQGYPRDCTMFVACISFEE